MPGWKNQHYVPQHYLRGWASNDDKVEVFHLEHGEVPETHISNVCSEDYLYGDPPHVERELGRLEDAHSGPINDLREGSPLRDLSLKERALLLSFVSTQFVRSKYMREDIDAAEDMYRDAFYEDLDDGAFDFIEWEEDFSKEKKADSLVDASLLATHQWIFRMCLFGHLILGDMQGVVLRNVTEREFITSDIPIVLDNPRFKEKTGMGPAGLAESGTQIYCPIDPKRVLFLYDPAVYELNPNSRGVVHISSTDVVDEINLLQFHNAGAFVLHSDAGVEYLEDLRGRREDVKAHFPVEHEYDLEDGRTYKTETKPPYQTPAQSPSLPDYTVFDSALYSTPRPMSRVEEAREWSHRLSEEASGFDDIALIVGIRRLVEATSQQAS